MVEFFKKLIGERILKTRASKNKREKAFCNIDSMKSVGILFENTGNMYVVANKMMKFFLSRRIKISAIVFENIKQSELENRKQFPTYVKIFTKSNLTWYGKPDCNETDKFMSQNFDVLIDMSRSSNYVFKYISTLSMAKFKIGGIEYQNDPFDLILLEKSDDVTKFVSLIINFLSTIKVQNNARK
ncbi:MAG: hypothetical protein LBT56_01425 [Prevotellaceae bacterium]|jgi:hypothetical protein|nr:hypothetical protein [Prevotellaceae bacterium]